PVDQPQGEQAQGEQAHLATPPNFNTLDQILASPMGCTFRGIIASVQGIPPALLLIALARVSGRILSQMTGQGDLTAVLKIRADMKREVERGIGSVKPTPLPQTPQAASAAAAHLNGAARIIKP